MFFEFAGAEPASDGNWTVAASLLPAMVWGEGALEIEEACTQTRRLTNTSALGRYSPGCGIARARSCKRACGGLKPYFRARATWRQASAYLALEYRAIARLL